VLQAGIAYFRPHPEPKTTVRKWWEIEHRWGGRALAAVAAWQIFDGIDRYESRDADGSAVARDVWIAWIFVILAVFLVMEITARARRRLADAIAEVEMNRANTSPKSDSSGSMEAREPPAGALRGKSGSRKKSVPNPMREVQVGGLV